MAGHTKLVGRHGRASTSGLFVLLLLLATACEPVTHPDRVVVDPAETVGVLGLSGDGNFVVVSATVASASVPGPGRWRIDRRDGTATALPAGATFARISHDGQRLLLDPGTGTRVWSDGAYAVGAPDSATTSSDLRFAIFHGLLDPRLIRVDLATGERTPFGPPGLTARNIGISDDGTIAWYDSGQTIPCRTTFVLIATGATTVHDACGQVSASGRHLLLALDLMSFGGFGGPTRLQIHASANPGIVLAEVTAAPNTAFAEVQLAAQQPVVWAAEVRPTGNIQEPCGTPFTPPCEYHEDTRSLVVTTPRRTERMPVPSDLATLVRDQPLRTTVGPSGRFLVHVSDGLVYIHDRIGPRTEVLAGDRAQGFPLLSGDGRVVVVGEQPTGPGGGWGWYEHRAMDEPPPPDGP